MADEEMEENSPKSTSQATPPPVDNSPETTSQPSPPEEQRESSSADGQPPEVADSPDHQRVNSTSDLKPNDDAGSSNRLSAAEILLPETNEAGIVEGGNTSTLPAQSFSDAAPEMENQPQPDAPADHAIRLILETPPVLARTGQPVQSVVEYALIQAGLVSAALGSPLVLIALEAVQVKLAVSVLVGSSQEIANDAIKQNIDEEKSDSNQQFDAEQFDSSSASKSSSENVELGSDSSPTGSVVPEDERKDSGSNVTETADLGSGSSPRIGTTETVGLESELSQSKTDPVVLVSGSGVTKKIGLRNETLETDSTISVSGSGTPENIRLRSELSPSKTGTSGMEASGSRSGTPERRQEIFSPKRKSPTKLQHSSSKRSTQFLSPDKLQMESDSQMSTLLEELGIKETENQPGSSEPISGHEQERSTEIGETGESQN